MSVNFGTMKLAVSKLLRDPQNNVVSLSDVGDLVNQALQLWKNKRFWFNTRTSTASLISGNPVVAEPENFLVPATYESFFVQYSTIKRVLIKLPPSEFTQVSVLNSVGMPFYISKLEDAGWNVWPIPGENYSIVRYWVRDYADFSADSDANDFTTYAHSLLQYQAASFGMSDYMQDEKMATLFEKRAQQQYQSLMEITSSVNATGNLIINDNFF